ncbi:VWA domain-containing protein [Rubrivirga sp. S365]|uniref:vWA domain-containing protein n=1 Tax=Rubrivirga sp. S365 TaxID=3076080 RepID=UPI0028C75936|nr:VWA domain-containing protein [Rubrivirga sp. S365]MDT7856035.1 VWA domain-containing protein [Rubrivirga sp. S365]
MIRPLVLLVLALVLAACGTSHPPQETPDAAEVDHVSGGAVAADMVGAPAAAPAPPQARGMAYTAPLSAGGQPMRAPDRDYNREGYAPIDEAGFKTVAATPLSTFSIDVDRASYANTRRFLEDGRLPPPDAVRIEELVNAFDYGLPGPAADGRGGHPFAVTTEVTEAPWAPDHHLVRIGLQGRRVETDDLPPANLVFLLDVSGSMSAPDKLPLLQRAFRLLVREMRPQDRVAIVVYAGASGVVLEPTPGTEKGRILAALDRLQAGGATGGAEGLRLAYRVAREHFDAGATNRVVLATDGDFNVGVSSDAEMKRLVEQEREGGVMLSVLGFGTGNLQDSKMETLADHGNGNYAYIDGVREAERVFVREFGGTLFAIAKDVKLQVEFNPARVAGYRLIGYENRTLAAEDFNDDRKDAGELGAGHTVTALYEVVPVGVAVPSARVDALKYQAPRESVRPDRPARSGEWLTVSLRYKPATTAGTFADESVRLAVPVAGGVVPLAQASEAGRWAVAVTEAGLLLRRSDHAPGASYDHALALARAARGADPHGDRAEFVRLVETAAALAATEGGAGTGGEVTLRD